MKEKIKLLYAEKFSSSPIDISDEEIEFIITRDCECDMCGKSIFEFNDFPEINIDEDEFLCEECYSEECEATCPICEEVYNINELPSEFPKSPFYYIGSEKQPGIYHALNYPVFSSATGGLGTTIIWWNSVEFVCSMEDFLKATDQNLETEFSENWKDYLKNKNLEFADFIGVCCYQQALKIKLRH